MRVGDAGQAAQEVVVVVTRGVAALIGDAANQAVVVNHATAGCAVRMLDRLWRAEIARIVESSEADWVSP